MTRLSTISSSCAMRITLLPPDDVPPLTTPKRVPTMLGGSPWMPSVRTLRAAGWLGLGFGAPGAESGRVAQALSRSTPTASARKASERIDPPNLRASYARCQSRSIANAAI
jgi:hypothetical protein